MRTTFLSTCLAVGSSAYGSVVVHTSYESWSAAVGGGDAIIDFDLGSSQDLFDQYGDLGVHFGGTAFALTTSLGDGWGAITLFPTFAMKLSYDSPQYGIGLDLINPFKVSLFSNGQLIYQSPQLNTFGPVFRGISTDVAFDTAVVQSIPSTTNGTLDNIYVSNPIPEPAAVWTFAMFAGGRRRRRP